MPIVTATHEATVAMKVTITAGKATVEEITSTPLTPLYKKEGDRNGAIDIDQLRSTIEAAAAKVGLSDVEFTLDMADNGVITNVHPAFNNFVNAGFWFS